MAHFAHVTQENNVCSVIVIEQDVLDAHNGWPCPNCGVHATRWVQTSHNTVHGAHTKGGTPLRKNFAGVGFTYDPVRDAFIPPKPYASWVLDEDACDWKAPKKKPTTTDQNKTYKWNEALQDFEKIHSIRCACGTCMFDDSKLFCVKLAEIEGTNPKN